MKMYTLIICAGLALAPVAQAATTPSYRSVGYVEEWAQYRTGNCAFTFDDINANLYTHVIYAFAQIAATNGVYTVVGLEGSSASAAAQAAASYAKFATLKQRNPKLRTLISIGGSGFNAKTATSTNWIFGTLAATEASRQQFATSAVQFARANGFDGLDIDWEFPANPQTGGKPQDTQNFTLLLEDLRRAINAETLGDNQERLLLTIAASATSNNYKNYQLASVASYVDWINLMTYDYHGSWESQTGALAPVMTDAAPVSTLDDATTVQDYLAAGVPADKIVLGLAGYGRNFADVAKGAVNAPSRGNGLAGPCTKEPGLLDYGEIVAAEQNKSYVPGWDAVSMTPFAYNAQTGNWVSYENPLSIGIKLVYLKSQRLGGAMLWSIDSDDPKNGYPLSTVIQQTLLVP